MAISRREFIQAGAAAWASLRLADVLSAAGHAGERPNILWLVSEDNNPFLGCYGDKLARTPALDKLAADGVLFENCHSACPVCAPSRFALVTGMHPVACGPAHHMRAQGRIPPWLRGFPAWLRDAGYFTSNNAKTDYNAPIRLGDAWDECGARAHWRNRPAGKPFFAVFNHEVTHESCLFAHEKPPFTPTDPARIVLPPYHPDTPEFRDDWACYYDRMALLDRQVAQKLKDLEQAGLAENTIVFYYGDNGGVLPRSKRFLQHSGTHVPLIVRFPEKFRHLAPAAPGSRIPDPVGFVDFAPTVLGLAGVKIPDYMHGRPFAGPLKAEPRPFVFCSRDRMDERYDMMRCLVSGRWRYIRNYMPHLPCIQHVQYQFRSRSYQAWERLHRQGKLTGPSEMFWQPKPAEELYDLQADPHNVANLAGKPECREILQNMRTALKEHMLKIRDNGFIPEGSDLQGFEAARDPAAYPLERIMDLADLAIERNAASLPRLLEALGDKHEALRWWAGLGCVMLGGNAAPGADALQRALADPSGAVQVAAAQALCQAGRAQAGLPVLERWISQPANLWFALQAANALENLGETARPSLPAMRKAAGAFGGDRQRQYVQDALNHAVARLQEPPQLPATAPAS